MDDNTDYKQIIIAHHKEGLGASDAKILAKVDELGYIPKSCEERLAIIKGFYEKQDDICTQSMAYGNQIELQIFDMLHSVDERWESNKYIESEKYSKPNCKLFCHIDFFKKDDEEKVITFIECKATSKTIKEARHHYSEQLYIENMIGKEYIKSLGKGWKFNMKLCHYNTNGYDGTFKENRLDFCRIRFGNGLFDIDRSMTLISSYLDNMTEYYREDIEQRYLPEEVKQKFDIINTYVREIKEREDKVKEFKEKMFKFMDEKDIKSIKTDVFTLTKVEPTETITFDKKKFEEDHKTLYKKYLKKSNKKGYALLKLKGDNNIN